MQTLIIVIHLMIVSAMVGVVLLQRSEGGGLGIGSTGGFLTSRGTSNVLTRTTAILAALFFTTSLALSIIAGVERKPQSIIQGGPPPASQPGGPVAPPPGSPLDAVGGGGRPAPQSPAGPQVPQSQ